MARLILAIAVFCTAWLPAQAQTVADPAASGPALLSVTGTADIHLPPDMATLRLSVSHRGETAVAAMAQVAAGMGRVIARLASSGVAEADMQTSGVSLGPVWAPAKAQEAQGRLLGYQAENGLVVQVRNLPQLGQVLDAVVADGANRLQGISFGLQDSQQAQDQARRAAVADAQRKAALYAEAAGLRLGALRSLSEGAGQAPMPMLAMRAATMGEMAMPVAGGTVGLRADVSAVYALIPRALP